MKELDFYAKADFMAWDEYHAFHVYRDNIFVQFITGEVIVRPYIRIRNRKHYPDLGVSICSTSLTNYKFAEPGSDVAIPRARLSHNGQQILLVDHTHNIAVSLEGWTDPTKVPTHLARSIAYYPNDRHPPIGGTTIKLYNPYKRSTEFARYKKQIVDGAKAMSELDPVYTWQKFEEKTILDWFNSGYDIATALARLNNTQTKAISNGLVEMKQVAEFPHLKFLG